MSDQLVGSARVRIEPDTRGFDARLASEVNRSAKTLDRIADSGARIGERLGTGISNALRITLTAGAVGVAAAVSTTLLSGFRRFANIEDATRSLTIVLGDAAKAGKLLDDVIQTVIGTPFALDQFSQAAGNLAAFGVEIEKIPRILTAIGDAAAASGRGAEGVGVLLDAIGRIATSATLSLGPVRDLEQLGVPALKILANQAGISADEMAKEITKGSISSVKAIDALVRGIEDGTDGIAGRTQALGGVAKGLGTTTRGALDNFRIAIARLGARILKTFNDAGEGSGAFVRILNGLRKSVDLLADRVVARIAVVAGSKGFGRLLEFFDRLPATVDRAVDNLFDFVDLVERVGLGRAIAQLFGFGDELRAIVVNMVSTFIRAFEALPHAEITRAIVTFIIRGIGAIAQESARITVAFLKAAPAIVRGIITGLLEAARDNPLDVVALFVAMGLPGIGPIFSRTLTGVFGKLPFGSIVAPLFVGISKAAAFAFSPAGIAAGLGLALATAIGLSVDEIISKLSSEAKEAARQYFNAIRDGAGGAVGDTERLRSSLRDVNDELSGITRADLRASFQENVVPIIDEILPAFIARILRVAEVLGNFFGDVTFSLIQFGHAWGRAFGRIGEAAFNTFDRFRTLAQGIGDIITGVLFLLGGFVKNIIGVLRGLLGFVVGVFTLNWSAAFGGIARVVRSVIDAFVSLAQGIPRVLRGILKTVVGVFGGIGSLLFDAGRELIGGFISGIIDKAGDLIRAIKEFIVDKIPKFIRDRFESSSPSMVFARIGKDLIDGLILGLEGNQDLLERSVNGILFGLSGQAATTVAAFVNDLSDKVRRLLFQLIGPGLQAQLLGSGFQFAEDFSIVSPDFFTANAIATPAPSSPVASTAASTGVTIQQMNVHTNAGDPEELALQFSNRIALRARRR